MKMITSSERRNCKVCGREIPPGEDFYSTSLLDRLSGAVAICRECKNTLEDV